MNDMYDMSLTLHSWSVLILLAVFVASLIQLQRADAVLPYLKKMRIQTPVIMMVMFAPIFTGIVMMAAKHLSFTVPNIVMIVLSITLIYFEIKRSKPLRFESIVKEGAFEKYKIGAKNILVGEIAIIVLISIWMYLL
ncbi:MAG: hypothetical protein ABFR02_00035 [Campylobacterota bacterium]